MRGRGGPGGPRGPPRMGLGYSNNMRGMGNGGPRRGRGGYQGNNDFAPQNDNIVAATTQSESPEKTAPTPVTPVSQSGNNVQVVTTQPAPSQTPQQASSQPQSSSIQSNQSMGRDAPRGFGRGRGFSSRGSSFRGRGGFNQDRMPPRQQFDTRQPSNLTPALPPKMSRYDQQQGSLPPKRGRYGDSPYMGNRSMTQNQAPPPMASQHHQSYNNVPPHGNSGYQDQSQYGVDQYQHSGYNSGMQQSHTGAYSANGGYNQSYSTPNSAVSYSQSEYDHSSASYQDYGLVKKTLNNFKLSNFKF